MNIDYVAKIDLSPDTPASFVVEGSFIYILAQSTPLNKIIVYNISNPSIPVWVSTTSDAHLDGGSDITLANPDWGNALYIITNYTTGYGISTRYHSKIVTFNRNPAAPSYVEECDSYTPSDSSAYTGGFIRADPYYQSPHYIRESISGTFDTMWSGCNEHSILSTSPRSHFIDYYGYAYVVEGATDNRVVQIYDVGEYPTPELLGTVPTTSVGGEVVKYSDIVVDNIDGGTYAYIVGYHYSGGLTYTDIVVYNVYNASSPVLVDSLSLNLGYGFPNRIAISDDNLFVCVTMSDSTVRLFDISNPASVSYVTYTDDNLDYPTGIDIAGNYVYVRDGSSNAIVIFEAGNDIYSSSSSSTEVRSSSSTEVRSSSSSSFSSASSRSTSSSSHDFYFKDMVFSLINENHFNLIPFTWIGDVGDSVDLGDNSKIPFIVQASNSAYVDYQAVISRDDEYLKATPTTLAPAVYVPQSFNAEFQHENCCYIDIVAKDKSGISEIRTHVEPNKYQFEKVNAVFFIPKFSWDNTIPTNTSTTTTESSIITTANSSTIEFENAVWVGTSDGVLKELQYKKNPSDSIVSLYSNTNGITISSYVNKILFSSDSNDLYISTNDFIYIYGSAIYLEGEENYHKKTIYDNPASSAILYSNNVWSVQPYGGKVIEQNPTSLVAIKEYENMDAPFKVVKSEFHNTYFIAGSHILWVVEGNSSMPVYEINDYQIVDFDVMESGQICILFHGLDTDIIRVIDNNLKNILLDQRITNETLRFCKACKQGKFYILSELDIVDFSYPSAHYVFDINSKVLLRAEQLAQIATTTSTTTSPVILKAVKVQNPNGGEVIQKGTYYEIQWATSKSISDFVKIEIYKGGNFYSSITEKTANSGIYRWAVSTKYEDAETYTIRITWISASSDPNNYADSDNYFTLTSELVTTTTTTSLFVNAQHAVGIDYDIENDMVVFVLKSGLFGMYHLPSNNIFGLVNGNISNVTCMAFRDTTISYLDRQTKIRVFVGSEMGLSDKWDSGEIETQLTSIYYGGGNNLEPGKKYYVNIQTYSEKFGWSEVQVKEFVMIR